VDIVLRVVGVVVVQNVSNVLHIFFTKGSLANRSISGGNNSMSHKKALFSVVQDLMHHCSLVGISFKKIPGEASPWEVAVETAVLE
jgi:hypothetical protein